MLRNVLKFIKFRTVLFGKQMHYLVPYVLFYKTGPVRLRLRTVGLAVSELQRLCAEELTGPRMVDRGNPTKPGLQECMLYSAVNLWFSPCFRVF